MVAIAHLGSRPLSRECLRLMHEDDEIDVRAVCTYPRGYEGWWEGSLHKLASDLGYSVVEESEILEFDIDYIVSTLYYNVLGPELLEHPTYGGLNLHQAELPRYRGSNSFSHAILNAAEDDYYKYGTTVHFMSETVDAGDIVDRRFVEIEPTDTAKSLYLKTEVASVELFEEMLPIMVSGEVNDRRTPQNEFEGPRYFYSKDSLNGLKFVPAAEMVELDGDRLWDRIRAVEFPPFKPAFTEIDENEIFLTTQEYGDPSGVFSNQ